MATLSIRQFQGLRPRVAQQALHDEIATVAKNANLVSGELRPILAALSVHQFEKVTASQPESVFEPTVVIPREPTPIEPTPTEPSPSESSTRCVAVRIDQRPVAISRSAAGEAARSKPQFTVSAVSGYTPPLGIQWYINGKAERGATDETIVLYKLYYGYDDQELTVSPAPPTDAVLRFSPVRVNISVVLTNPCGRARADTSFTLT